jgi:hypothetical protein
VRGGDVVVSGPKATTGVEAGGRRSEVNLLGNIQRVVHLNSEVSDGAFQLGVTEEKLDCTQVACLPINLGSFVRRIECVP